MPETSKIKKDANKAKKLTEVTEEELNRIGGGGGSTTWDVAKVSNMRAMFR